ncbi:MAG TPA: hypothetical protein VFL17_03885, partial [Anaerolineae bacterium]|nr:hypothetical protein [Anaerolineae bacterium]
RAAADDLPPDPQGQNTNTIIVISAGQDRCLESDPCRAMASVAQSLERSNIDFQLEIVALKPDEQTRLQLTCLVRANVNGRFHEANSVNDLRTIFQEIEPAQAVPGVQNGSFESGDAEAWSGEGIEVVAVEDADVPDVGQYAAQMKPGQALEQTAKVPGVGQPQLTVWYRAPGEKAGGVLKIYVNGQLEYTDDSPADRTGNYVAADAPDWLVAVVPAEGFAGQEVTLRIEYAEAASRAGGVLRFPARQVDDVLWVDNVAFVAEGSLPAVIEATPTPSATPALRPTPGPDASQTPTLLRTATLTPTPPVSVTATLTRTPTAQPLTFTWRAGAFRESGRNDQGVGIWAQEIFVEARGGVPPYTILFDNAPKTTMPFDVFGLYCIGQVGTITVRSADGQVASQRVTIRAPLCPTNTPTPTATRTRTPTASHTPTPLPTTDDISNFSVVSATDTEIQVTVDYAYIPAHGADVWLGVWVLSDGEFQIYYGYAPALLSSNSGRATVRVTYGYNDPPASLITDQIEVIMYTGDGKVFYSETFDYLKTWSLAPPLTPASSSR